MLKPLYIVEVEKTPGGGWRWLLKSLDNKLIGMGVPKLHMIDAYQAAFELFGQWL